MKEFGYTIKKLGVLKRSFEEAIKESPVSPFRDTWIVRIKELDSAIRLLKDSRRKR